MTARLQNKVRLVTGAGSGIGRSSALGFAGEMGRLGTLEEMAELVVWLCSDASSFVTGHAILMDGGAVAR